MRISRLTIVCIGLTAVALTGCSTQQPGTPDGKPTTGSTTATSGSTSVTNPLNTSKILDSPCEGLTDAQLAPYQGAVGSKQKGSGANSRVTCTWFAADVKKPAIFLNIFPKLGGQAGMENAGKSFPYFKKADPIQGYFTTHLSQGADGPQTGDCQTDIAANDQVVLEVRGQTTTATDPNYTDMCKATDALMTALIGNLKNGG
ncbi:DUF3558 domain-containing protein [Kutzneria albida]|uniref:Secreted protein n=1 Tax=Kutzneria albida DSM 43870 TaxID=1449976 RepID=W5VZE3_9PSEU|nr:DUF3558 domain-containing protein [Kutzneria albida]AHH93626.1 hypothetical protein KALB_249 [Kutzneria albida DSM 43870]